MKLRFLSFFLFLCLPFICVSQNCLSSGIEFTSQNEINNFATNYPTCTSIEGDVKIESGTIDPINSLAGLSQLTSIGGDLNIRANDQLGDLSGLENITSVGSDLLLITNDSLGSLSALSNLTTVTGNLKIINNDKITSLFGLHNLFTLSSFSQITIEGNALLTSTSDLTLSGTSQISTLIVRSNDILQSFTGLTEVTNAGSVTIAFNPLMASVTALNSLDTVITYFRIQNNPVLNDISGFSNLRGIGIEFFFSTNPMMATLESLSNLQSVSRDFYIRNNANLHSLFGLSNLTRVGGNILEATLEISSNPILSDISALSNLTTLEGELVIKNNAVLTNLNGLDNIDPSDITDIEITGSPMLSVCDVSSICTYLGDVTNSATITGNQSGCLSRTQIIDACEPAACPMMTNMKAIVHSGTSVHIGWDKIDEPYGQKIRYRVAGTSAWTNINPGITETNARLINNLTPNTTYEYRGRVLCGGSIGNSSYTPIQTFTTYTTDPCSAPEGTHVMFHKKWDYSRVRLMANWEPDASLNGRIQVEWKEAGGTTWTRKSMTGKSYIFALGLLPDTDYEVRWRARCNIWTAWGPIETFRTLTLSAPMPPIAVSHRSGSEESLLNIQVFPNPTRDVLHIVSEDSVSKTINLYDVAGKLLLSHQTGDALHQIDMSTLKQGSYFLQIIDNSGTVVTEKITKL